MEKLLKKIKFFVLIVTAVALSTFYMMGRSSQNQIFTSTYDQAAKTLGGCPDKPNCISSFAPTDSPRYIAPIKMTAEDFEKIEVHFSKVCKAKSVGQLYKYYICESSLFRFVDDLEILTNQTNMSLGIRSASRVGHSDMGANRKRIKNFIKFIKK
jgi:uncharacterized protein (DUF1499 family)